MENGVSKDIQNLTQTNENKTGTQTEELLKKNLEMTQEIYEMTKKIKRHITFQKIVSLIYFLIIVVPIILSIIYLPPLLKGMVGPYMDLLDTDNGTINLEDIKIEGLSPELQKLLE